MTQYTITHKGTAVSFDLVRSRRKSVGITVHRDGRVTVRAPQRVSLAGVKAVVQNKAGWILERQREFAAGPQPPPPRRYASGEQHYYLGQPYELVVTHGNPEGVSLANGRMHLHLRDTTDYARKEKLLTEWYRARAKEIFAARLDALLPIAAREGIPRPLLKVRVMKRRWGSCHAKGTVILNLKLVLAPPDCIDLVIMHELAHLKQPNHSKAYYALLGKLLPDWRERSRKLDELHLL